MNSLCQLGEDWRGDMPAGGLAYEQKHDGWRALYMRGFDGEPRLYTRNGHRIEGTAHIVHRLRQLERAAGQPLVIDGEFQVDGSLEATKAWCERGWRAGGEAGLFHAFDVVPVVNWVTGGWDAPWIERKAMLAKLAVRADADASLSWEWREGSRGRDVDRAAVLVAEDGWCFTPADVFAEARRVWSRGGEGIMLKDPDAPYQRKRSEAWRKVKRENAHLWMRSAA